MTDEYEYYSNNNMCNVCQAQMDSFQSKKCKKLSVNFKPLSNQTSVKQNKDNIYIQQLICVSSFSFEMLKRQIFLKLS